MRRKEDDQERITRLEVRQDILWEDRIAWQQLIRGIIKKLLGLFAAIIVTGLSTGWAVIHLPETIRKAIADWISK